MATTTTTQAPDIASEARTAPAADAASPDWYGQQAADEKGAPDVDAKPQPLEMQEEFSKDAQYGVQRVEATAMVWSKAHLITAYFL